MPNWQPLSKEKHSNAGWVMTNRYPQAQQDAIAPLLVDEMSHASAFYPMAFAKRGDGSFRFVALLSLEQSTNLFINLQHKWMVPYIPAHYRSGPFNLLKTKANQSFMAVDIESEGFSEVASTGAQPVFNEEGALHESIKPMMDFLKQRDTQQQKTDQIVEFLGQHGLLIPWENIPAMQNVEGQPVVGLYRIDERALHGLSGDTLSKMMKNGAMAVAYSHLLSLARMTDLQTRYKLFKEQTKNITSDVGKVDLDAMFGENSDNDLFSF